MRVVTGAAVLAVAVSLFGCGDEAVERVVAPEEEAVATPVARQMEDSVAWDENGVMEFYGDDGNHYRLVREGPYTAPGSIGIWENGIKVAEVELFQKQMAAEEWRWHQTIEWIDTDHDGDILDTSLGMPGGGGGGPCHPSDPGCVDPQSFHAYLGFESFNEEDCEDEATVFRGHSRVALTGAGITGGIALVQIATGVPLFPFLRKAVTSTVAATVASGWAGYHLLQCLEALHQH